MDSRVTVAILNWNGLAHLQQFLPSVVSYSGEAIILVIDNASTDPSVGWIKNNYPKVELHILTENMGFTGGYNEALNHIKTEYVVLLNSDVEVSEGWLGPLVNRMDSNPLIAACQPKIMAWRHKNTFEYAGAGGGFLDVLGYPFCRGRIFETCEEDLGQYNSIRPVFWASGACMMVRTSAFLHVGGFEKRFFAHMEEIDLCWRFWSRGYQVWVDPDSTVYHLGAGTLSHTSPKKTFLNYRNGIAMLFINSSVLQLLWKIPFRLILDGLAGLRFIAKGEWMNCLAVSKAHISFYGGIRYWLKRRKENEKLITTSIPESVFYRNSILPSYFLLGKKTFEGMGNISDS